MTALLDDKGQGKVGDGQYYAQELFEREELTGYLRHIRMDTKKSVYEQVIYGSGPEADFADRLEKNTAVKVYAKLSGWFRVPTPLGGYNPDWAVLFNFDEQNRLYFVVETKSTLFAEDPREKENDKIKCGREHFRSLCQEVGFKVAKDFDTFIEQVIG